MKYVVSYGYMHKQSKTFDDFVEAVSCYGQHFPEPDGVRLVGEGADCDHDADGFHEVSDGLTEEERLTIALVEKMVAA